MVKKSINQKRDGRRKSVLEYFLKCVDTFDIKEDMSIPIMCLDVSSTSTGFMMMSANIFDDENELAELIPVDEDINTWNKTQTIISSEKTPYYALYPYSYNKIKNFSIKLRNIVKDSELNFMAKNDISPLEFYSKEKLYPKFLSVESVFLFQKTAIVPLTRFQNTAISILVDMGYIPFEYENQEAKSLIGASGKKEFVTPLINDMYGIEIPETEKYTHVTDAIALGYFHNYIMRKAIRER